MELDEELFILRASGEVLLHLDIHKFEEKEDKLLFGSFISAIMEFAQSSLGSGIQNLNLKNKNISFLSDKEYEVVIALISQESKRKHLTRHLNEIHALFTDFFDEKTIKEFDGDLSIMKSFSAKLGKRYKRKMDDFFENF
ncbi:MAG: hypothetical protein BAJALOKI1v1_840003 [Promethearchaeota archaeon]|nr:MAG: hypothetical protein BAJALOKI1v1_840003 [Candidatus Lokiarchaeota archaeon]